RSPFPSFRKGSAVTTFSFSIRRLSLSSTRLQPSRARSTSTFLRLTRGPCQAPLEFFPSRPLLLGAYLSLYDRFCPAVKTADHTCSGGVKPLISKCPPAAPDRRCRRSG